MNAALRNWLAAAVVASVLAAVGFGQSWSLALALTNLCLISAIMSLAVNIQWGYAGLFNIGIMGFAALGGLAGVLVSKPPVKAAWAEGGGGLLVALAILLSAVGVALALARHMPRGRHRAVALAVVVMVGLFGARAFFDPAVEAIEAVEPAKTGYLGGLGLPIMLSWLVGGLFAAAAAYVIGRIALGLRADYFAIATLGISEIVIAILKNEDWLTRGVKNVTGLGRPVPYEVDLQHDPQFIDIVAVLHGAKLEALTGDAHAQVLRELVIQSSSLFVKLCYGGLFLVVLALVFWLSERALHSPWGRMMRAIRDNERAASALGKDVTGRHRQVFILGSAVAGIAGAMLTTLDGQFTPASYQPLRFTFLIWVMVVVGGSGNNLGAVLGGFLIWFAWVEAEPAGLWLMDALTSGLSADSAVRAHLLDSAAHMRPLVMGLILLLVMRFRPDGLIPAHSGPASSR